MTSTTMPDDESAPTAVRVRRGLLAPFRAWRELRRQLRESHDTLERSLRASGAGSLVHLEALEYLGELDGSPVPQSQLQEALGMSQSSTSRLVTRLEAQGLVRRSSSAHDARASLIALTAIGVATTTADLQAFEPQIRDELRTITEALVPTTAPGAESLLLPRDDEPTSHELQFGETVFSLSQATSSAMEAMAIREALEPHVLANAAANWKPADMRRCREVLDRMRAALDDAEEFFRADWELHRVLLSIGRNRMLEQIYGGLLSVVENNLDDIIPTSGLGEYLRERLEVHVELIDAVASGNPELLHQATNRHAFTTRLSDRTDDAASG